MSKSCSPSAAWRRTTRQSGAGSSATIPNWNSGYAVISSRPTNPGVSMRPMFASRVAGATSIGPSIPRAPPSTSCSPALRDAAAAKRLFRKALTDPSHPQPRVINTNQARISDSAIPAVKEVGTLRRRCRHRPVQYLNNVLEQDHRAIKRRMKAKQGFREFHAARRTIQGDETMDMIRKGQARWVSGSHVRRQIQFIKQAVRRGCMRRRPVDSANRFIGVLLRVATHPSPQRHWPPHRAKIIAEVALI